MEKIGLYFSIVFSLIGFVISFLFAMFSGNGLFSIIYTILISTLLSFILGYSVYFILKSKVPEVLEVFSLEDIQLESRGGTNQIESEDFLSEDIGTESAGNLIHSESEEGTFSDEENKDIPLVNEQKITTDKKVKHFGDHIIVDKITIKNEPKLMAEAIRTMLSKDES